jgi:hypothetical protein
MNTRYIAEEYRLAHWTKIMQDKNESGLSIKAFCNNIGIHETTYFYWQRKLRLAACGQLAMIQPVTEQKGLIRPGFAEVKIHNTKKAGQHSEEVTQGRINIEVSGVRISAGNTYPVDQLAHLLRELVHQC